VVDNFASRGPAHSGNFHAVFGPIGSTGGIQQVIPAQAGDSVAIGFWYRADPNFTNSFSADFDGHNLVSYVNDASHTSWTQYTFTVTVGANNPTLSFTFRNDPAYDHLDDVTACVTPGNHCCWTNGDIAGANPLALNGQLSHLGGGANGGLPSGGQAVADDFFVCASQIEKIFGFDGFMLTDSLPGLRKAQLEFYNDCNGSPVGSPFKTYINPVIVSETAAANGFTLVHYHFDFSNDPLWLDGGFGGQSYWVSLIGLTDGQGVDTSFWATTPAGTALLGSVPVKRVVPYSPPGGGLGAVSPWEPIAQCCIGCVNMVFSLDCKVCVCGWDNGPADLGVNTRGGSLSGSPGGLTTVRTFDDFIVKPCEDVQTCFIEAWIWTNCNPPLGFIELYANDCDHPGSLIATLTPTRTIATGEVLIIGGAQFPGYRLQYYGSPVTLQGGSTYWISAGANGGGSLNQRAYFAYKADCSACQIRLQPGRYREPNQLDAHGQPTSAGIPTTRDYAFRICFADSERSPAALPGSTGPQCAADLNLDGVVNLGDIFAFLHSWFAGCP